MIPANTEVAPGRDAGVAAVEAWCAAHQDLWEAWASAWTRATGSPLRITVADEANRRPGVSATIEGGGQIYATLMSAGRSDTFGPWLQGVAGLIGESLAMEAELNTMTDELVDSYDQLT